MNNLLNNLSPVVKNILIICVICFIGSSLVKPANDWLGVYYPDSEFFHIWQPITYMFMHADIGHIFFNMFALVMFGPIIERMFGSKRFLNYYLICALGALVLQYGVQAFEVYQIAGTPFARDLIAINLVENTIQSNLQLTGDQLQTLGTIYRIPMVGASGAIFGLLLAFAYFFPNMPLYFMFIPVPIKAKYFVGGYILIEIYLGFNNNGSSIAHLAHVGGALFGYLLIKAWGIKKGYY
ncbi:rhomboid family intramembrane serine protease [Sphingobacterium rhinopitheci]|uniref:rhomboid family intramembrane serine protease n=1 Tax=Sphingobacterium rhinopitheci TaxID=2781960 RepID=UPI001F524EBB|nr:rhomboid family intramembrane serine protease [Sphingobacterium rhinopitheci]MCI0920349.1 rhomboid family intramembrane serine protease [Sphingobacterium rhinopitheci]